MRTTVVRIPHFSGKQLCRLSQLVLRDKLDYYYLPPPANPLEDILWLGKKSVDIVEAQYAFRTEGMRTTCVPPTERREPGSANWWGFSPNHLSMVRWERLGPGTSVSQLIALLGRRETSRNSWDGIWELLYVGAENGESALLEHLLVANSEVRPIEVLSARNQKIGRFLRGQVVQSADADAKLAKKYGPYWPLTH